MAQGRRPREADAASMIAQGLVKEWLQAHAKELQKMWDEQIIYKLPPL